MGASWSERLNRAMGHIEEHITVGGDLEQAARIAGSTLSSFQRTFAIITGMPLSEYIRRRRLTLAAFALQNTGDKVIDIALRYGYESPEAFARVFRAVHGASPSQARREGVALKAFPPISFLLTIKGVAAMDYRIETKEAFSVYGIEQVFTTEEGKNLVEIPRFWQEIWEDGRGEGLIASTHRMNPPGEGELCPLNAICGYEELPGAVFPYMIYAYKTPESDTAGYKEVVVPAATWAIFRTREHTQEETSAGIQELIAKVYTDWLPTAPYERVDGYDLELYYGTGDKCRCETWIRVAPQ